MRCCKRSLTIKQPIGVGACYADGADVSDAEIEGVAWGRKILTEGNRKVLGVMSVPRLKNICSKALAQKQTVQG